MRRGGVTAAKLAALALLLVFAFVLGRHAVQEPAQAPEPDYDTYDPAQLSWVIEGIQERISELQDELHYVVHLQAEKLAARPPPG